MKNMKRALMKKNRKDRTKTVSVTSPPEATTPTSSPVTTVSRRVSDMPLSMHVSPRRESAPIPLVANTAEAWSGSPSSTSNISVPKVNIVGLVDDNQVLMNREGVIGITRDVQKFLATTSELRQAMEEYDAQPPQVIPIRILSDNDEDLVDGEVGSGEEEEEDEEDEDMEGGGYRNDDNVVKKLRELAEVVEVCLSSNPGMQSTVLIDASKNLLKSYKNCSHENGKVSECSQCNKAMDFLVDTFTQCVTDYMSGETSHILLDLPSNIHHSNGQGGGGGGGSGGSSLGPGGVARCKQQGGLQKGSLGFSKSHDNLAMFGSNLDISQFLEPIVDRVDQALAGVKNPVDVASSYIKCRQKYHRELVGYLNKRAQLEQRYYAQLGKIVKQSQNTITELEQQEDCLPLVNVFRQSLDNDSRYAMNCNTTFNLQVTHKILEPLERQIVECEKMRKNLMSNWLRERKKVVEARSMMKNAKTKYEFYGQELIRIKNLLGNEPVGPKADKRKKEIIDLEAKWQESEAAYKDAVAHCNDCQYQVHEMAQKSILCAFRRMIIGFDSALKDGLESYFKLQHNFFQSLPSPLLQDIQDTQEYDVGSEFLQFISRQQQVEEELEDYHFQEFDPEAENVWDVPEDSSTSGGKGLMGSDLSRSSLNLSSSSDARSPIDRALSPTIIGDHPTFKSLLQRNDTPSPKMDKRSRPKSMALLDTITSKSSSSSFYTSDSPKVSLQRRNSDKGKESTSVSPPSSTPSLEETVYSKMARTHGFKKLRTPARCRGCDTYVYFHGFDCDTCGLACHRKCLASLAIRCGSKKLPRKMNVFGIGFHEHLKATKRMVPIIVTKCINEIDERGLDTQGLYRISSAKSKMEKLCQLFESGSERVDLSDLPPHLISSCLKLYFRQLPEPVLTFDLYQEFLTFAREASHLLPCNFSNCDNKREEKARELLKRLEDLVSKLSESSQLTLARLMYHLHRVSSPDHVRVNCMPASNLGIVFGPNLLRQKEVVPSLALLANMSFQAKAVEIMVAHVHDIFHIPEDQIMQLEVEASEEIEMPTNERPIDIMEENSAEVIVMRSDINDTRTPLSTPPERRRQNVEEFHEMIEGFSSGNPLSPISHQQSKNFLLPATMAASPLLTDSRHWQEPNEMTNLPGCIDDNFVQSILTTMEQRWTRPFSGSVPMLDKVLTPVMEIKDDNNQDNSSEESGEIHILPASANNTMERQHDQRRRAHSLTKSSSTGFGEEYDSVGESDVFHSRTASNASSIGDPNLTSPASRLGPGSHSIDNLLQQTNKKVGNNNGRSNHVSNGKVDEDEDYLAECPRLSNSTDSLKYNPFESPEVQALISVSKSPAFPHPHTFPRPANLSFPTRQMSEPKPVFSIGSPPLDSPVSLKSMDKTISMASSQGSFSEGFVDEVPSTDIYNALRRPIHSGSRSEGEELSRSEDMPHIRRQRGREKAMADSGIGDPMSINGDEIPLPDDSPTIGSSSKYHSLKHKHSLSRDSGLSDSPDPFVDFSSSPSHGVNSRVLTDKLTQEMKKSHPSPLINRNWVSKPNELSENSKKFQELLLKDSRPLKPRPQNLTRHVMKVMRITPSLENEGSTSSPPPPLLSPDSGDGDQSIQVQRLRMASPDELMSPTDRQLGFSLKRSRSQGEVLKLTGDDIDDPLEEETRVGGFIISEAKARHKTSRAEKKISRSMENLLDDV